MPALLRAFRAGDEPGVYRVCLGTGDAGQDGTHLYQDAQALGNVYVGPYMAFAPGQAFVLEDKVGIAGYVLGVHDSAPFYHWLEASWFEPLRSFHPKSRGGDSLTPDELVYARYHQAVLHESALFQKYPAHVHIDILPRAQGQGNGRRMMEHWLSEAEKVGVSGIHLEVAAKNERAIGFYRKLGFERLEFRAGEGSIYMGRRG